MRAPLRPRLAQEPLTATRADTARPVSLLLLLLLLLLLAVVPSRVQRPEESVEWVQCEGPDCGKWRILPHTVRASALPDRFECHMCHWNEEGASCDAPEDTVEGAHWLYPGGGGAYGGEPYPGDAAGGGAAARLTQCTEQMLLELEAQANQMLHQRQQQKTNRRAPKQQRRSSPNQQQRSPPQPRLPKGARLPSEAGDAAAYTDFAALFRSMEVPGATQPLHTPAIQRLRAVGVKPHLALSLARFSVARHRLYKQKLAGNVTTLLRCL